MRQLIIAATILLPIAALAQQPSPSDMADALAYKSELFHQNINRAALDLVAMKRQAEALDEKLKWVLDNWVSKPAEPAK